LLMCASGLIKTHTQVFIFLLRQGGATAPSDLHVAPPVGHTSYGGKVRTIFHYLKK
jgi:hypothetical protein